MTNLTTLSVPEFENRMRSSFHWLSINRQVLTGVARDLRSAADHIELVGWTQHKNFVYPRQQATSPCCAVGALHAVVSNEGSFGLVASAVWTYEAVAQQGLVEFNDDIATEASQVVTSLRTVADVITTYLEASNV